VVPIFHGGDRSLDVKYRNHYPQTARDRAALLWDDYMLLLTAVLFVCIAEAIPKAPESGHAPAEVHAQAFYHWMAIMLGFDVAVLIIDRWKSRAKERVRLKPYIAWIIINSLLGLVCWAVSGMSEPQCAGMVVTIPLPFGLSVAATLWQVSFAVFLAALLRTVADYEVEQGFLLARANRSFGACRAQVAGSACHGASGGLAMRTSGRGTGACGTSATARASFIAARSAACRPRRSSWASAAAIFIARA
jgi:hypothetical protein